MVSGKDVMVPYMGKTKSHAWYLHRWTAVHSVGGFTTVAYLSVAVGWLALLHSHAEAHNQAMHIWMGWAC